MPAVVVAPVRALVQRLGPHVEDVEPIVIRPGDRVDRDALVEELVAAGYRREYQVEARGELAVRGSILDVYPSTDDHPVRIDLWGDEVERLSGFSPRWWCSRRGSSCPRRRSGPGPPTSCGARRGDASSGSASPRG
jgi:transcription-repair coupling factor (superfamily II helicase)